MKEKTLAEYNNAAANSKFTSFRFKAVEGGVRAFAEISPRPVPDTSVCVFPDGEWKIWV